MILQPLLDQLLSLAVTRANTLMLARAATELPGISVAVDAAGLRLTGRHLHARAFGTRHRRRDPRFALFLRGSR